MPVVDSRRSASRHSERIKPTSRDGVTSSIGVVTGAPSCAAICDFSASCSCWLVWLKIMEVADVEAIDWGLVPASQLRFEQIINIAHVVYDLLGRIDIDGVVVVQGTDSIEETAFAFDLMLPTDKPVAVTGAMVNSSPIIPADQKAQISAGLEENAQLLSNTELDALIVNQPADVEAEILRINTEARPIALQIALLVPLIAGLLGFLISLRMVKIPEVKPAAVLEGLYG